MDLIYLELMHKVKTKQHQTKQNKNTLNLESLEGHS